MSVTVNTNDPDQQGATSQNAGANGTGGGDPGLGNANQITQPDPAADSDAGGQDGIGGGDAGLVNLVAAARARQPPHAQPPNPHQLILWNGQ